MSRPAFAFVTLALVACASDPSAYDPASAPGKADDTDEQAERIGVESVWREQSAEEGKQHIAILRDDLYTHSEQFLLFGEKNGSLQARSFVGQYIIIDREGFTETASDDFYDLTAEFITDDLVEITLIGRDGRRFDLVYERLAGDDVEAPTAQAIAAANKFYKKFDQLMTKKADTLANLKAFLRLHMRSYSYAPEDDRALDWQFEIGWLQIESYHALSAPDAGLAGVAITQDGDDAISKHFFERLGADAWTTDADLPDPQDILEDFDWESGDEPPSFYQFHPGISGLETGVIADGLDKFADYTILALHPFECEDGYDYQIDRYWVLSDGSILDYQTSWECD